jgi:hypothetical protein
VRKEEAHVHEIMARSMRLTEEHQQKREQDLQVLTMHCRKLCSRFATMNSPEGLRELQSL